MMVYLIQNHKISHHGLVSSVKIKTTETFQDLSILHIYIHIYTYYGIEF